MCERWNVKGDWFVNWDRRGEGFIECRGGRIIKIEKFEEKK